MHAADDVVTDEQADLVSPELLLLARRLRRRPLAADNTDARVSTIVLSGDISPRTCGRAKAILVFANHAAMG